MLPRVNIVLMPLICFSLLAFVNGEKCTVDGDARHETGVLVPAEQCETFLQQPAGEANIPDGVALVCCPVFHNEPNCGKVSDYDNSFDHDSRETHLDQFPWAVVVMHRFISNTVCSGSLITREFVLSAAHCYVKTGASIPASRYSVRLGDWDLLMDRDCKYVRGVLECNEAEPQEIRVHSIINHQDYQPKRHDFIHDIALLKLARMVEYSGLIRPACLPSWSTAVPEIAGQNFTATGWGSTRSFWSFRRKLKVGMKGRNVSVCVQAYGLLAPEAPQVQLCVGGELRKDVCYGDSGGALMRREQSRWLQVGIVSFGAHRCGWTKPGVYTNVAWYMDWIQWAIQDATG